MQRPTISITSGVALELRRPRVGADEHAFKSGPDSGVVGIPPLDRLIERYSAFKHGLEREYL